MTPAGSSAGRSVSSRATSSTPRGGSSDPIPAHTGSPSANDAGSGSTAALWTANPASSSASRPRTNTVVIGTRDLLGVDAIVGGHARWCGPAPDGVAKVGAQLRAHGEEYPATAWADGDTVHVRLAERARGVAPGQSVVLYAGTRVIGSATIHKAFAAPASP